MHKFLQVLKFFVDFVICWSRREDSTNVADDASHPLSQMLHVTGAGQISVLIISGLGNGSKQKNIKIFVSILRKIMITQLKGCQNKIYLNCIVIECQLICLVVFSTDPV